LFKPSPFKSPVSFRCLFCVDCCRGRHVYLTVDDVERISRLGHDPSEFVTLSIEDAAVYPTLSIREWDLGCAFHDPETGRCRIHEAKPLICRIYPFMVSRKPLGVEGEEPFHYKGRTFWLYYDGNCPGINAEEPETAITSEEIAELGLEFEEEFRRTSLDALVRLVERLGDQG